METIIFERKGVRRRIAANGGILFRRNSSSADVLGVNCVERGCRLLFEVFVLATNLGQRYQRVNWIRGTTGKCSCVTVGPSSALVQLSYHEFLLDRPIKVSTCPRLVSPLRTRAILRTVFRCKCVR